MTQTHYDEAQRSFGSAGNSQRPSFGLMRMVSVWAKKFQTVFVRWANRRAVYRLSVMDDRLLSDIGLTREDVTWALSLPGETDPSEALNDLVQRRRDARNWALRHGTR